MGRRLGPSGPRRCAEACRVISPALLIFGKGVDMLENIVKREILAGDGQSQSTWRHGPVNGLRMLPVGGLSSNRGAEIVVRVHLTIVKASRIQARLNHE